VTRPALYEQVASPDLFVCPYGSENLKRPPRMGAFFLSAVFFYLHSAPPFPRLWAGASAATVLVYEPPWQYAVGGVVFDGTLTLLSEETM
jgi:hypothetical protein